MGPNDGWQCDSNSAQEKNCTPMLLLLHFSVSHVASLFICLCSLFFFSNVRFLRYDCVTHFCLWHVFRLLTMGSVLYVFTSYYGVAPILLDPCFFMCKEIRGFSPNVVITLYFLNLKNRLPECRLYGSGGHLKYGSQMSTL